MLINPLRTTLHATLLSEQILDEAGLIIERARPELSDTLLDYFARAEYIFVLLQIDIDGIESLYEPTELSPEFYPGRLFYLNELEFTSEVETNPLQIMVNNQAEFSTSDITLYPGQRYIVAFRRTHAGWDDLSFIGNISLRADLQVYLPPPFQAALCDLDALFDVRIPLITGEARAASSLYGELNPTLSDVEINELRLELLTEMIYDILPFVEGPAGAEAETTPPVTDNDDAPEMTETP